MPVTPIPDHAGIVWPDPGFLRTPARRETSPAERATAYAQRLIAANPQLVARSVEGPQGVHLAARNARVLLTHVFGAWAQNVRINGRNHRYGSILDVEWFDWPGEVHPERADIKRVLEPFVTLNTLNTHVSTDVKPTAFREAFGHVEKLGLKSRTPSHAMRVQREQALLRAAMDSIDPRPMDASMGPAPTLNLNALANAATPTKRLPRRL